MLGLTGDKLKEVLKFAERISLRKEIRDILSADTVRELVFEWIGARARGRPADPLLNKIIETVHQKVKTLVVWVPIEETQVEGELAFADTTLKMVSRRELDALIDPGLQNAPAEAAGLMKEKLHRRWLGMAAMRFSFEAELARGKELAQERAETYMTLLQFYGPATTILPLTSYAAPYGSRPRQQYSTIAFHAGAFIGSSEGVTGPSGALNFTAQYKASMEKAGLFVLSSLALDTASDYEDMLLRSLLVYGRACYQMDSLVD